MSCSVPFAYLLLPLDALRLRLLRLEPLRLDDFLRGTRAPERRAFDSPMAMACLRLVTLWWPRPLFKVPRFRARMAVPTFFDALLLYFAMMLLSSDRLTTGEAPLRLV